MKSYLEFIFEKFDYTKQKHKNEPFSELKVGDMLYCYHFDMFYKYDNFVEGKILSVEKTKLNENYEKLLFDIQEIDSNRKSKIGIISFDTTIPIFGGLYICDYSVNGIISSDYLLLSEFVKKNKKDMVDILSGRKNSSKIIKDFLDEK